MSRLLALALTLCCAVFVSSATASPFNPSGTETRPDVGSLVQRAACASRRVCGPRRVCGAKRVCYAQGLRYETRVWLAVLKGVI